TMGAEIGQLAASREDDGLASRQLEEHSAPRAQLALQHVERSPKVGLGPHRETEEHALHDLEAGSGVVDDRRGGRVVRGQARRSVRATHADREDVVVRRDLLDLQAHRPEEQLVARLQARPLPAYAVHARAVLAAEVLDEQAVRAERDAGMTAGHASHAEDDLVAGDAAEAALAGRDAIGANDP